MTDGAERMGHRTDVPISHHVDSGNATLPGRVASLKFTVCTAQGGAHVGTTVSCTVLAIAGVWTLYFATSWSATSWGQPSFIVIVLMVGSAGLWLSLRQQCRGRS